MTTNGNYERNAGGQESRDKTACTKKKNLEIVGNGKPTGSVLKETIAVSATILISMDK